MRSSAGYFINSFFHRVLANMETAWLFFKWINESDEPQHEKIMRIADEMYHAAETVKILADRGKV